MKWSAWVVVVFASLPAFAQPPASDPVQQMKKTYYERFANLPPTRACNPQDVKGIWHEKVRMSFPQNVATSLFGLSEAHSIGFGSYNRFVLSTEPLTDALMAEKQEQALQQFIATDTGMLYLYQNGAQQGSLLCFVVQGQPETAAYTNGSLLLALPVGGDKPLTLAIYVPNSTSSDKG